jgi:hypothetical protein
MPPLTRDAYRNTQAVRCVPRHRAKDPGQLYGRRLRIYELRPPGRAAPIALAGSEGGAPRSFP